MSDMHPRARDLLARAAHGHDPTDEDRVRSRSAIATRLALGGVVATAAVTTSLTKSAAAASAAGGVAPSVAPPAIGLTGAGAAGAVGGAGVGGAGVAAGAGLAGASAGTAATAGAGAGLAVKVIASILVAGSVGVGAVEVHRATRAPVPPAQVAAVSPTDPARSAAPTERAAATATAPLASPPPVVEEAPTEPTVPVTDLPRVTPTRAPLAPARSTARSSAVQEEAALLGRAQDALRQGDGNRALAALDEHARRFPHGALSEERDAARVLTLCALGQKAEAAREADRFVAAYPRSPQLERVRRACAP